MEYIGDDFDANMANMTEDPKTREWWAIMEPMQQPVENRKEGQKFWFDDFGIYPEIAY